jgi:hypothetical protein
MGFLPEGMDGIVGNNANGMNRYSGFYNLGHYLGGENMGAYNNVRLVFFYVGYKLSGKDGVGKLADRHFYIVSLQPLSQPVHSSVKAGRELGGYKVTLGDRFFEEGAYVFKGIQHYTFYIIITKAFHGSFGSLIMTLSSCYG